MTQNPEQSPTTTVASINGFTVLLPPLYHSSLDLTPGQRRVSGLIVILRKSLLPGWAKCECATLVPPAPANSRSYFLVSLPGVLFNHPNDRHQWNSQITHFP